MWPLLFAPRTYLDEAAVFEQLLDDAVSGLLNFSSRLPQLLFLALCTRLVSMNWLNLCAAFTPSKIGSWAEEEGRTILPVTWRPSAVVPCLDLAEYTGYLWVPVNEGVCFSFAACTSDARVVERKVEGEGKSVGFGNSMLLFLDDFCLNKFQSLIRRRGAPQGSLNRF